MIDMRTTLDRIAAALAAPDYDSNRIADAQRLVRAALAKCEQGAEPAPAWALSADMDREMRIGKYVIALAIGQGWTPAHAEDALTFLMNRVREVAIGQARATHSTEVAE